MSDAKFVQIMSCEASDPRGNVGVYILALDAEGVVWEYDATHNEWVRIAAKRVDTQTVTKAVTDVMEGYGDA